jgi:hypothetical protein
MRWARNVKRKERKKIHTVLEKEPKDRGHFEDQSIVGKLK